jgi:hypothetical protein
MKITTGRPFGDPDQAASEEQMEFEKFLSKYNRRCKALTLGYRYLHGATMAQAI